MFSLLRFLTATICLVVAVISLNLLISSLTVVVGIIASLAAVITTLAFYVILTIVSIYACHRYIKSLFIKEK